MATYFAYEVVCVLPPHVSVGSHVHSPTLKRSECPRVWRDKKSGAFSMSQQATHKLWQRANKQNQFLVFLYQKHNLKMMHTLVCFFLCFLSLKRVERIRDVCKSAIKMQPVSDFLSKQSYTLINNSAPFTFSLAAYLASRHGRWNILPLR